MESFEGVAVVVAHAPSELKAWNGSTGRILRVFSMANGKRAAVVKLDKLVCEVVFPLDELERRT